MIVDVIGLPAAGKTTVTRVLENEFPEAWTKYNKKVKAQLEPRHLEAFKEAYPEAWKQYNTKILGHNIGAPLPEGVDFWRDRAEKKHHDEMKLYMLLEENPEQLLIWNKGFTQLPVDLHMYSSHPYRQIKAQNFQKVWPPSELVVVVKVSHQVGWDRYIARKEYRMSRRARSLLYPPWPEEVYMKRASIWSNMDMDNQGIQLDNEHPIEKLQQSTEWKEVLRRIRDR